MSDLGHEQPKNFETLIQIGKEMSAEEVRKLLADFHGAEEGAIDRAFINLRDFNGTVIFRTGINRGRPCIIMAGYDGKTWKWNDAIDSTTGNPLQIIS